MTTTPTPQPLRPVRDYYEPSKEEKKQHLKDAMKGFLGNPK